MIDAKRPRLVGGYIRNRRETLGLSQRALGLLFVPPVTTQFISNVERGVTPLPPAHVPTLARALNIPDTELMNLLEREYSAKLNERLGRPEMSQNGDETPDQLAGQTSGQVPGHMPGMTIAPSDLPFMQSLYDAYKQADPKTRQTFANVCESILNVRSSG